jgi:hypothetical protein
MERWDVQTSMLKVHVGLPRLVTKVAWTSTALQLLDLLEQAPLHKLSSFRMMAEVQAQPAPISESKTENQAEDKDALIVRLDELLEKYLHTLDEYQNTRGLLSKQLSSVRDTKLELLGLISDNFAGLPLLSPSKLSEPVSYPLRTRQLR